MLTNKNKIIYLLNNYIPFDENEKKSKELILNFINKQENIGKTNLDGHITASGFVINLEKTKVLLNHHIKLDKWIQFGGHIEENEFVFDAAVRETIEETGVSSIKYISDSIFDIDVHKIPLYKTQKAHIHYDIRFLFELDDKIDFKISEESKNIKWILLNEIENYTKSESILRMKRKIL